MGGMGSTQDPQTGFWIHGKVTSGLVTTQAFNSNQDVDIGIVLGDMNCTNGRDGELFSRHVAVQFLFGQELERSCQCANLQYKSGKAWEMNHKQVKQVASFAMLRPQATDQIIHRILLWDQALAQASARGTRGAQTSK